jgi:MoaA/NifB/PqqE/SkfB family radical SAM enzyme
MAFGAALPAGVELLEDEVAATFVVPAPNGCNLNCRFCAIRARRETVGEESLAADDFVCFFKSLADKLKVGAMTLQGHEPLLPESWPYSIALLSAGRQLGIPTAIVTNGTFLSERIAQLASVNVQGITVSLDSGVPGIHDEVRGTPGAFNKTLGGIQAATEAGMGSRVSVASVLQPGLGGWLDSVPELLASLKIRRWMVSPLFGFQQKDIAGPMGDSQEIVSEMVRLQRLASRFGVEMMVDDEFSRIAQIEQDKVVSLDALRLYRMKRLEQILRLSPNGAFSFGRDILKTVSEDTPVWKPASERADLFILRAISNC